MGSQIPTGRWVLDSKQQGISSLHYDAAATVPEPGPQQVLVRMHAASLNYRDLAIARGNPSSAIPLAATPDVTPGSDGCGEVVAVGGAVPAELGLRPGTRVVAHMVPGLGDDLLPGHADISAGLGQAVDGTLCRVGAFHHSALVALPDGMDVAAEQAATFTCSGLTAWNAMMGLRGREVRAGDYVLVQGTGGVSVAALQIAKAAGATVVATTSSGEKARKLRDLGADHILDYTRTPDWGAAAKQLTPGGRGVDHVVDVGGAKTLPQAIAAVRLDGLVTVVGVVAGSSDEKPPEVMSALWNLCMFRGVLLGTRAMLKDMVQWFHEKGIRPAVDKIAFELKDADKAYERLEKQEHFSKIVITIT